MIADLMQLGQDVNNAIYTLMKLKSRIDTAVAKHTELKIDRRIVDIKELDRRAEDG